MARHSSREIAISLRKLADKLDSIPEMQMLEIEISEYRYVRTDEARAAFIAEIKSFGAFEKEFTDDNFNAIVNCGAVKYRLFTDRSVMCTKRTVTKEVEVDEWDCDSILEEALRAEGVI